MLKGLTDAARERFELDVLRPPTFEQLSKTLRNAKAQGKPYHIVHFDGHGGYLNTENQGSGIAAFADADDVGRTARRLAWLSVV